MNAGEGVYVFLLTGTTVRYIEAMASKKSQTSDLVKLVSAIRTKGEAKRLLTDLLTPQELEELALRWQIVQLLAKEIPQREIAKKLGVSITKITRGSRALQYGSGGFDLFLKRLKKVGTAKKKR